VTARRRQLLGALFVLSSIAACGRQAPPPAPAEPRREPSRREEAGEELVARSDLHLDTAAGAPDAARGGAEAST
jgi:hypothetical protein